jgi:hypothetical protein
MEGVDDILPTVQVALLLKPGFASAFEIEVKVDCVQPGKSGGGREGKVPV